MSGRCDQLSGVIEFYSKEYLELMEECKIEGLLDTIHMPGAPLEHYLAQYNIPSVDWISVDCEGCEASFITTFNFTKFEVQIVNYEPNTAARMHTEAIEDSLARHGLQFDRTLQDMSTTAGHPALRGGMVMFVFGMHAPSEWKSLMFAFLATSNICLNAEVRVSLSQFDAIQARK